jgi:hypothetical protein
MRGVCMKKQTDGSFHVHLNGLFAGTFAHHYNEIVKLKLLGIKISETSSLPNHHRPSPRKDLHPPSLDLPQDRFPYIINDVKWTHL